MLMKSYLYSYVPHLIDEELLFSWISRLHFLNAQSDPRKTLASLFGTSTGILSADLPCRLRSFIERTAGWGPFASVEALAMSSTLLPYYVRFFPPDRVQKTFNSTQEDKPKGLKLAMGLVANGFGASTTLRSCATCDSKCIDCHGCVIWHRVHQLPGVLICPTHREPLQHVLLQSKQSHRQQLILSTNRVIDRVGDTENKCVQRVAVLSDEALKIRAPAISAKTRREIYARGLAENGFVYNGRVNWRGLVAAIREEYADFKGFPFRQRLMSTERWPARWLYDLCCRPERALHPLCHLLLIGLLFKDVRTFFSSAQDIPQVNQIACHATLSESHQHGADALHVLLKNQKLSCRQVAHEAGISTTTVVLRRRSLGVSIAERRKTITPSKFDEIKRLLQAGSSPPTVAHKTGLSLSSVYRSLALLPGLVKDRKRKERAFDSLRYRAQWLDAKNSNPTATTKQIRTIAGAAYAWLYRHESTWLNENVPLKLKKTVGSSPGRVNWPERDRSLAEAVFAEAARVAAWRGGRRVSASVLLRATGLEATVRRNLERLPLLSRALIELAEDDEAFCTRRRTFARAYLVSQGHEAPSEWRIERTARIRTRKSRTEKK